MGVRENNYENMTFGHLCDMAFALQECGYTIEGLITKSSGNKQNIRREINENKGFFEFRIAPLLRDLFCTSEINWPKEWAIFEFLVKGFSPQTLELQNQELVQKIEELAKSNAQLVQEKEELAKSNAQLVQEKGELEAAKNLFLSEKKKQMDKDADTIWFWQMVAITSVPTSIMSILFMVSYYLMYIKPMH